MKKNLLTAFLMAVCVLGLLVLTRSKAAETITLHTFEYATIRWGGRDNTHVIRPGGKVEFVGSQLAGIKRPDRTDDRAFYMNIVMNALAKEGYEFSGMDNDEIVMRRPVTR